MKIAVLCGGLSNERDVSITTGTGVAKALALRGHSVALCDLFLGISEIPEDINTLFRGADAINAYSVAEKAPDLKEIRKLRPADAGRIGPNIMALCRAADFVFLALHGEEGENGKLQAALDLENIKYTGSGYLGSAIAMNKEISKTLFRMAGIPTPEGVTLARGEKMPEDFPVPCVVKPCSGGSSVGTTIVREREELDGALAEAFRYEDRVLVEHYIRGRELTVGVMDGRAMPVIEIIPKSGFYDYKNKYQAGSTLEICPAEIGDDATNRVQAMAEQMMQVLKIDAYCRGDFLWDTESDIIYCLEANTLPGMTPTSLIPQMAAVQGHDYGELCEQIIEVSRKKYLT